MSTEIQTKPISNDVFFYTAPKAVTFTRAIDYRPDLVSYG